MAVVGQHHLHSRHVFEQVVESASSDPGRYAGDGPLPSLGSFTLGAAILTRILVSTRIHGPMMPVA